MTMTRAVATALVALAAIDARPAAAEESYRPWCVQYLGGISGGTTCAFDPMRNAWRRRAAMAPIATKIPGTSPVQDQAQGGDRPRAKPR